MGNHGIFISHKHDHRHLAGRIYDFFKSKGINPFLDIYSLQQGDYKSDITEQIKKTPYFLCVLTPGALDNLNPSDPNAVYYKEIETAFEERKNGKKIFVVISEDFVFPKIDTIPEKIRDILNLHYYRMMNDMSNFYSVMETLYNSDIHTSVLSEVLDWKELNSIKRGTFVTSRLTLEREIATLKNRFGKELIDAVENGVEYTGEQRIKHISMSCYAASIIFTPQRDMVDDQAYDRGLMFNIFAELLKDPEFSLEMVINAPSSCAVQDSIDNEKLGNSALESRPEAVFLGSYASVRALSETDPVFVKAKAETRFRFMVTDSVLPYALFQIVYKDKWKQYNHIKIDLYSEKISSSTERRSMIIFEDEDRENYNFFAERYRYIRNARKSAQLISQYNEEWLEKWEKIKNEW